MLDQLTDKLARIAKTMRGQARLTEANMQDMLREIRVALLEADVALPVVREFIARVKGKALGEEVAGSLTPGQALVGVVHRELAQLMGADLAARERELNLATQPPAVILLAGLQGAGKTTTAAKLAKWLIDERRKKVLTVSTDVYRPAAIEQLKTVSRQAGAEFFSSSASDEPIAIARRALDHARRHFFDVLIVDTAGRLAIDEAMMQEVAALEAAVKPIETLFVVDAMLGQDAVNTARAFAERLPLTGVVLTKLDGDARGGAALSVKAVTGKPIKFVGMGESPERLEEFRPDGMASRILGRGDVVGLIQQFEDVVDEEKAEQDAMRMLKGKFDMNDFLEQIGLLQKMGSLREMIHMIPGMADHLPENVQIDDKELDKIKAIISSMTQDERRHPERFVVTSWEEVVEGGKRKKKRSAFYDQSRLRRVARGSGRRESEVADILNRFATMRQMMMHIGASSGLLGKIPGFRQLGQLKQLKNMAMGGIDLGQLASMMGTPSRERGHFSVPQRNMLKAKAKKKRQAARAARKKSRRR